MFKVIGHMGDGLENIILGLLSSILPHGNALSNHLSKNTKTNYFYQETIKSGHSMFTKSRILEIQACQKGCSAFIGRNVNSESCFICNTNNDLALNEVIYYFPLRDRISSLIASDLKKFLTYSRIRRSPADEYIEDIYDGANWKRFESQMIKERYLFKLNNCSKFNHYYEATKYLSVFSFVGTGQTCLIIAAK